MLICKNVVVNGQRTSMRQDQRTWVLLNEICARENITLNELITRVNRLKDKDLTLSMAMRVFAIAYLKDKLEQYEPQFF